MRVSERSKALYWKRRNARRCTKCDAGLQDDDVSMCVECCTRSRLAARRLRAKRPGLAAQQELARYHANPEPKRAYMRTRRKKRLQLGICSQCSRQRMADSTFCVEHRECQRLRSLVAYYKRTGQPVREAKAQLKAALQAAKKPSLKMPDELAPADVRVVDFEQHGMTSERVLRALRFFDWVDTAELFGAMNLADDCDSPERNTTQVALGRLVKQGLVEIRERLTGRANWGFTGSSRDYRITEAGRAAIGAQTRRAA